MEKKLNRMIADYIVNLKQLIKQKAVSLDFSEESKIEDLIQYVYNIERLNLSKDDVSKRKRIKNTIPVNNRCHAKRANGEQCTRKQKEGHCFCGTHVKGSPHGEISINENKKDDIIVCEVFAEEIGGIVYYLDKNLNVYSTEDILKKKKDPEIIAKCTLNNNVYNIPEFGI
jgi:hypothetical protein